MCPTCPAWVHVTTCGTRYIATQEHHSNYSVLLNLQQAKLKELRWEQFSGANQIVTFEKSGISNQPWSHFRASGADDGGQCRHSRPPADSNRGEIQPPTENYCREKSHKCYLCQRISSGSGNLRMHLIKYLIDASVEGNGGQFRHSWPLMASNRANWWTPTFVKSPINVTFFSGWSKLKMHVICNQIQNSRCKRNSLSWSILLRLISFDLQLLYYVPHFLLQTKFLSSVASAICIMAFLSYPCHALHHMLKTSDNLRFCNFKYFQPCAKCQRQL